MPSTTAPAIRRMAAPASRPRYRYFRVVSDMRGNSAEVSRPIIAAPGREVLRKASLSAQFPGSHRNASLLLAGQGAHPDAGAAQALDVGVGHALLVALARRRAEKAHIGAEVGVGHVAIEVGIERQQLLGDGRTRLL